MTNDTGINPYLFFNGRCAEAIEFYRKTVNAEVAMQMHYKDAPPEVIAQQPDPEKTANQIMHARLRIGTATVMLADGPSSGKYDGFALALNTKSATEAERYFTGLAVGGKVDMPLGKTFFSPAFGMLTDRFGIKWMVLTEAAH
jgi:PhnB protein